MLLPFWLAMAASVALHVGVLLAPGWDLPLDDENDMAVLDATIAMPPPAAKPRPPAPAPTAPVRKRPPLHPPPPATPVAPLASVPGDTPLVPPAAEVAGSGGTGDPLPAPELSVPEPVAVLPAPSFVSRWPRSGRIVYQVMRGKDGFIIGQSEQRWEHDATRYSLHAETETTGLAALFRPARVTQNSHGIFDASGLRPLEFETQRDGKPQSRVRFDLEQGQIVFAKGGSTPYVPAAQDILSLFFQLAALSFDVPAYPLTVATERKVATYAIAVGEEVSLDTTQGVRRVRHLKVTSQARDDATEIWLDVESRLPLKIRHRDRKGEVFDQVVTLIEVDKTP